MPESDAPITGEVPKAILEPILADASQRTGVAIDELEITTAVAETWTDGSLGCPEPGMVYTQALVDGYQVVIDAAGESLDYRVGSGGAFILCEAGGAPGG